MAVLRWVCNSVLRLLMSLAAMLSGAQAFAASELQADVAQYIPQQAAGVSVIPLLRFWGLLDEVLMTDSSLTVPATMLASAGKGPAKLMFLPEALDDNGPLAMAVRSISFRRQTPVGQARECVRGAGFDTCCVNAPHLECFRDRTLFQNTASELATAFLMSTAADVLASDLVSHIVEIPVAGPYSALQGGKAYLALGYVPKTQRTRFLALQLDGKRMEALSHLTVGIAQRLNGNAGAEPVYICKSGKWRRGGKNGSSAYIIASGSPIDIRRTSDEEDHLIISADSEGLVVALRRGRSAGTSTFRNMMEENGMRSAIGSCLQRNLSLDGQIGLLNLLNDPDVNLFLAHALFLSGAWHANGVLMDLVEG